MDKIIAKVIDAGWRTVEVNPPKNVRVELPYDGEIVEPRKIIMKIDYSSKSEVNKL